LVCGLGWLHRYGASGLDRFAGVIAFDRIRFSW
jgi:hypothetical protein